jgi:hypothetical protein
LCPFVTIRLSNLSTIFSINSQNQNFSELMLFFKQKNIPKWQKSVKVTVILYITLTPSSSDADAGPGPGPGADAVDAADAADAADDAAATIFNREG